MVQATFTPAKVFHPRDYQLEAQRSIVNYLMGDGRRALVTMATGTGKTATTAPLVGKTRNRVLVMAHREELLDQWVESIVAATPDVSVGIEQADRHAEADCKVLVASVQTLALSAGRLDRLRPDEFSMVVLDEAHHGLAPIFLQVLAHFGLTPDTSDLAKHARKEANAEAARRFAEYEVTNGMRLLGLTATPNRSDKGGLDAVFDRIVFSYPIKQAIEDGWLVPVLGRRVQTGTSIEGVDSRGGDFVEGQLSKAVNTEARNALIVHAYEDYAVTQGQREIADLFDGVPVKTKWRQAIVFCVDAKHAEAVRETFARRGHAVGMVLGTTPTQERRRTIGAYQRGELRVLVGCMVFTEGFDAPQTSIVIMARPTRSSLVYTQCIGRGTRPVAADLAGLETADARRGAIVASVKPDCLVIDLMDTGKVGVQNLNTMFGLPPKLALPGDGDVVAAVQRVEEYQEQVSEQRLMDVESIADIERLAQDFDPLAIAGLPAYIQAVTSMAWLKTVSGYSLSLMDRGDIGVVVDLLGQAQVRYKPPVGRAEALGEYTSEGQAVQAAEAFVEAMEPDEQGRRVANAVDRRAAWRTNPEGVTEPQRAYLARLGRTDLPAGLTRGAASDLISKLVKANQEKRGKR